MKNRNGVIKFPFLFPNLKTEKGIDERGPLYLFSFFIHNIKKENSDKQPLLYMPSFVFPFGVIQLGKQIRNQASLCSFSD